MSTDNSYIEKQIEVEKEKIEKLTRKIQKEEKLRYHLACAEAEKRLDYVAFTQIIHTESVDLHKDGNLRALGEHIAQGAPFDIEEID